MKSLLLALSFIFPCLAVIDKSRASDLDSSVLNQLQFDTTSVTTDKVVPARTFGAVTGPIADFGLRLELPIRERLISWTQLLYKGDERINPSPQWSSSRYTTVASQNDFRFGAGIDRLWMLNQRHSWALVTGLGVVLMRRELILQSTPQVCLKLRGCDSSRDFTHDMAAVGSLRIGFRTQQVRLAAIKMDFAFGIQSSLARWPQSVILDPGDGSAVEVAKIPAKLYLETLTHF